MARIVLNQDQLAATAALLDGAAGEYQGVGVRILACDCGCMPADVASAVDSATASVRAALDGIASELSASAADLAQRSGVDQEGGFGLVATSDATSSAYGSGGMDLTIVSDAAVPSFGGGTGLLVYSDLAGPVYGNGGGALVIGGYDTPTTGGISLISTPQPDSGDTYLEGIRSGVYPDPLADIYGALGSGIRSPVIPIGSFDLTHGMGQLDLAGMEIGGTLAPNTMTSFTNDRGIVSHPLGTFAPLW